MTIWLLGKLFWTHIRIPHPDCLSSLRPCDLRVNSGGLSRFCLLECKRKRDTQPSNRHICTDISRWWREGKRKRGRQVGFPYRLQTKILIENSVGFLFYFMFFFFWNMSQLFFACFQGEQGTPGSVKALWPRESNPGGVSSWIARALSFIGLEWKCGLCLPAPLPHHRLLDSQGSGSQNRQAPQTLQEPDWANPSHYSG